MHALLGYAWLEEQFGLHSVQPLPVSSSAGGSRTTRHDGLTRHEIWPQRYHPDDTVAGHLSFAFRNEGIFLEQLARLYCIDEFKIALEAWINREPTGVYARRAGFLYEWLTGERLNVADLVQGNYADALPLISTSQVMGFATSAGGYEITCLAPEPFAPWYVGHMQWLKQKTSTWKKRLGSLSVIMGLIWSGAAVFG